MINNGNVPQPVNVKGSNAYDFTWENFKQNPLEFGKQGVMKLLGIEGNSAGADRSIKGQLTDPNSIARENWMRNEQSKQIEFDRQMQASNTEIQRRVADAKQAGINPVMALNAQGAGGASGGGGNTAGSQVDGGMSFATSLLSILGGVVNSNLAGKNAILLQSMKNASAKELAHLKSITKRR